MKANQIQKLGYLARLAINAEEADGMAQALSDILDFVERLDAAAVKDLEPLAHPLDMVQRVRDDSVTESNCRDAMQAVAPHTADGLYLVPKVIE